MSLEGEVLTQGGLLDLIALCVDDSGLVYVVDYCNCRVEVFDVFH